MPASEAGTGPLRPERAGGDLFHVLRSRSSSRAPFDPRRAVRPAELRAILESLRWSPTAHNMQNFEIVAIDDETLLDEVGKLRTSLSPDFLRESYALLSSSEEELAQRKVGMLLSSFPPEWQDPAAWEGSHPALLDGGPLRERLLGAPLVLLFLFDVTRRAPGSAGDTLGLVSLGCVLQTAWLAAEALGLSMQVVSALAGADVATELKRLLDVPEHLEIAFGARLGHPLEAPPPGLRVRREVDEFIHYNGFPRH